MVLNPFTDKISNDLGIEQSRKVRVLFLFISTGIIFLLPMGIVALLQNNFALALADFVVLQLLLGILFYFRKMLLRFRLCFLFPKRFIAVLATVLLS